MRLIRRNAFRPTTVILAAAASLVAVPATAGATANLNMPVGAGFAAIAAELRGSARPTIIARRADLRALPSNVGIVAGTKSIGRDRWAVLVVLARTWNSRPMGGSNRVRIDIAGGRRLSAVHHVGNVTFAVRDRLPTAFAPRGWIVGQLIQSPGSLGRIVETGRHLHGMVAGGMTRGVMQAEAGFFSLVHDQPPADMVWVVVEPEGSGSGDVVTNDPSQIDCDWLDGLPVHSSDCEHYFQVSEAAVTLNASAARESLFMGWGRDMASCGIIFSTCAVPLSPSRKVIVGASFQKQAP